MSNMGQRTPTETLSHRLRLMADAGGVLTRDRKRTCIEAADRLIELNDIVPQITQPLEFQPYERAWPGGDEHEEH